MSDQVIGISILDKSMSPQKLLVNAFSLTTGSHESIIPVYPKGSPKPETHNGAAWEYVEEGDTLHITPSLHCMHRGEDGSWVTDFHNGYSWSTKFQAASYERDGEWECKHMYEQFREANRG